MNRDHVILVTPEDEPIAVMDKMEAHIEGHLHRAFSVFILNDKGQMLLQQRAQQKYHGAGLWTNTCCSHPQWGEELAASANERLGFEMGLSCELQKVFSFIYHTPVENNLIEHEFDHVFIGFTDQEPRINEQEVQAFQWLSIDQLKADVKLNPEKYTYWFRTAMPKIIESIPASSVVKV